MSEKSSTTNRHIFRRLGLSLGVVAWTIGGFFVASNILGLILLLVPKPVLKYLLTEPAGILFLNALTFAFALVVIIGVMYWFDRFVMRKEYTMATVKRTLGVDQPIAWRKFGLFALCVLGYIITSTALLALAPYVIPGYNADQQQALDFKDLTGVPSLIIGFLGLVILPPVVEELLFRGHVFGNLRRYNNFWVSALITSILFGLAHGQWNVGIDVFALSIFLCILREKTGSIWMSMMLHGLKNGVAYFFLFIAPLLGIHIS